jgi:DNA repair protein RadC
MKWRKRAYSYEVTMKRKQQGELGLSFLCHIPLAREGGRCVRAPEEAANEMVEIRDAAQEMFGVLCLNTRNHLLDKKIVSVGVADSCLVHPREVFRQAILTQSAAVIVCHNHPSGDCTPSAEDIRITRQLIQAGQVIGIKVLDHVIVGRPKEGEPRWYLSLREGGLAEFA